MPRPRPFPFAVAILSLVVAVAACVGLFKRIADYNKAQGRVTYLQYEVEDREFAFAGREVTLTDLPADEAHPYGSVEIRYGDDAITLPVTIPSLEYSDQFPGLERHADWLRIVRFAKLTDRTYEQLMDAIDRGEEQDHLVVVANSPRPGVNPETWGRVWRKDWVFNFYEFLPEGGFRHERFAYPTVRSAEQQEQRRAEEAEGGIPELDTRSWQFQVAVSLMPEGSAPRIIAGDSPLVAAGWTFPTAVVCVLAAVGGLLVAFAPSRQAAQPDAPVA